MERKCVVSCRSISYAIVILFLTGIYWVAINIIVNIVCDFNYNLPRHIEVLYNDTVKENECHKLIHKMEQMELEIEQIIMEEIKLEKEKMKLENERLNEVLYNDKMKENEKEIINGELILTPKYHNEIISTHSKMVELILTPNYHDIHEIISTHFKIVECKVQNGKDIIPIEEPYNYYSIKISIFESMSEEFQRLHEKSIQIRKDSVETMIDILNMINVNNYSIQMTIKINTEEIIKIFYDKEGLCIQRNK